MIGVGFSASLPTAIWGQVEGTSQTTSTSQERDVSKEHIAELLGKLKGSNPRVRSAAAFALGEIGKPAVLALMEALKDDDQRVRQSAAIALAQRKDKSATPALIEALKDDDWHVRRSAAQALGLIRDKSAIPLLIEAVKDDDQRVRQAATIALAQIKDTSAIPALKEALKDENNDVRFSAAFGLGQMRSESAIPALIEALDDDDQRVRQSAADSLGEIPTSNARFYYYLNNKQVCKASKINGAVTLAREALSHENETLRVSARDVLVKKGEYGPIERLRYCWAAVPMTVIVSLIAGVPIIVGAGYATATIMRRTLRRRKLTGAKLEAKLNRRLRANPVGYPAKKQKNNKKAATQRKGARRRRRK